MDLLAVSLDGGLLLYSKSWGGGSGLVLGENVYQLAATLFALYLTAKGGGAEGDVDGEEKGMEKAGGIRRVERGGAVLYFHETTGSFLTVTCTKTGISHALSEEVIAKAASIIQGHGLSATNSPRQSVLKAIQAELETMFLNVLRQQVASLFRRSLLQSTCIGVVVVPSPQTSSEAVECSRSHFRHAFSSSAKESETLLAASTVAVPHADNEVGDDKVKRKPFRWLACFSKSHHRVTHHVEPSSTSQLPLPPAPSSSLHYDSKVPPTRPRDDDASRPSRMWRRQGAEAGDDECSESFAALARRCAVDNYTDFAVKRSVMAMRTRVNRKVPDDVVVVHDLENEAVDSHVEARLQTNSLQLSYEYGVFVFHDAFSSGGATDASWHEVKPGIVATKRSDDQMTVLRDFCLFARFCLLEDFFDK